MAGLSSALKVFEDMNMNLVHIESRLVKGTTDKYEIYLEIDSETSRFVRDQQLREVSVPFQRLECNPAAH